MFHQVYLEHTHSTWVSVWITYSTVLFTYFVAIYLFFESLEYPQNRWCCSILSWVVILTSSLPVPQLGGGAWCVCGAGEGGAAGGRADGGGGVPDPVSPLPVALAVQQTVAKHMISISEVINQYYRSLLWEAY